MELRSKEQTDKDNRSFTITAACTYLKPHHKPKPSHIACPFPMPLLSSSHRSPLLTTVADTSPSSASVVCYPTEKKQKPSVDKKERKERERERERLLPTRKIKKKQEKSTKHTSTNCFADAPGMSRSPIPSAITETS